MPKFLAVKILCFVCCLACAGCSITQAIRVKDRRSIPVEQMIDEVLEARLILVGERHDVPAHHKLQLQVLKAVRAKGKPLAIGMEMFEGMSQELLNAWVAGVVSEKDLVATYVRDWRNLPWSLYREILVYARDHRIPVLALNAPRQLVQKVSSQGMGSLDAGDLRQLPEGVNAPVPESYLEFIRSTYPMHGKNFRYLCEAQMLRNRVMARRIADYLTLNRYSTLVVLAGGGHVREKGGVPAELERIPFKIILPPIPGMTIREVTPGDADYLLVEPFLSDAFF